jgi:hypothetical protein
MIDLLKQIELAEDAIKCICLRSKRWKQLAGRSYMNPITKNNINNYVQQHIDPGDFLQAVLANDLREAFGRADEENRYAMFEIVKYCYNHIPRNCWGSWEVVRGWLAQEPVVEG